MPAESSHRRARPRTFTVVILPADESGSPRRITVGKGKILALGFGIFALAMAVLLGALIYTPVGLYIPIPNPELENRYHKQIVEIQIRLTKLTDDLVFLREYNLRLRKALGEGMSPEDSVFLAAQPPLSERERMVAERSTDESKEPSSAGATSPTERGETRQTAFVGVRSVEIELPLTLPVRGYATQEFNPDEQHFGIDFAAKESTPIYAGADGNVVFAGWTYDDGYMIILAHGNGYRTTYKHNRTLLKLAGEYVRRGEPIALLGNSGRLSYGPHLHFEVWRDGSPQDPRSYLLTIQ